MTRAQLLVRAAVAGGAAAAGPLAARAVADVEDDLALLEYLLSLEYVQSGLYRDALKHVSLSSDVARLARELRDHEVEHVDALRATIQDAGGRPPDRVPLRFDDALRSEARFLKLANTLEDTAVSAYNGAAPRVESREFLAVFASLAQIEARHAALVRLARDKPPAPLAFDKSSNRQAVRTRLRDYEEH
ncbi:MAG TPA: ferritin-like domain-containing protein [Solirubrobacteraceae bacterium]|jgi:rubrerythrin|nr:ferritin-like domain-containing protein [Solirubrobacteraceae bacterium]